MIRSFKIHRPLQVNWTFPDSKHIHFPLARLRDSTMTNKHKLISKLPAVSEIKCCKSVPASYVFFSRILQRPLPLRHPQPATRQPIKTDQNPLCPTLRSR